MTKASGGDAGRSSGCVRGSRHDRRAGGRPPGGGGVATDDLPAGTIRVKLGGGTSLDNSIRIGTFVETEWILLDLRPHLAVGDYGHGSAHIWSEDGHLMATASQTASMIRFDPNQPPPWSRS